MVEIKLSKKFEQQFYELQTEMQERIIAVLDRISISPFRYLEKLKNSTYYKLRVGDYRLIVDVEKDVLVVLKVGHRKNIYNDV